MLPASVADLLLWCRCRRQWMEQCMREGKTRRIPWPRDLIGTANLREAARVSAVGRFLFGDSCIDAAPQRGDPPAVEALRATLDPDLADAWRDRTAAALTDDRCVSNGLLPGAGLLVLFDLARYHPRLEKWEFYLIRSGTGVRGTFEDEAAMLLGVCDALQIPLEAIHILYLNKAAIRSDGDAREEWEHLFRESTVTGRARKRWITLDGELKDLTSLLENPENAVETVLTEDYRCRQGCRLCDPPREVEGNRYDVLTLHKGRHIGRELQAGGITDLREIDTASRRLTERQLIQIETVRSGVPFMDLPRLQAFLDTLQWPLLFLDFEAYSQSIPPFPGLTPYEHTPVIASLHRQMKSDSPAEGSVFIATPGRDERKRMFAWLADFVGTRGTIVVFSKPFESAMVRQIAAVGGDSGRGSELTSRMVDLLIPFSEFMLYHPDQRGKVSLKRILPIFTGSGYDHVDVQDGMHANVTCTRRADHALLTGTGIDAAASRAAEAVSRSLEGGGASGGELKEATMEDVARYCAMDTLAMVELVSMLFRLSGTGAV